MYLMYLPHQQTYILGHMAYLIAFVAARGGGKEKEEGEEGLVPTYSKNGFFWFRSPDRNKLLTLTLVSNKFVIDIVIGYLYSQ